MLQSVDRPYPLSRCACAPELVDRLDLFSGAAVVFAGDIRGRRQGLFAHDNTHHTMAMAYSLVQCLDDDGRFDRDGWSRARTGFEANVVED